MNRMKTKRVFKERRICYVVSFKFVDERRDANSQDFRDRLMAKFEQAVLEGRMTDVVVGLDYARMDSEEFPDPPKPEGRKAKLPEYLEKRGVTLTVSGYDPKAPRQHYCLDCPPVGYPTDKTRCDACPLREPDPPPHQIAGGK